MLLAVNREHSYWRFTDAQELGEWRSGAWLKRRAGEAPDVAPAQEESFLPAGWDEIGGWRGSTGVRPAGEVRVPSGVSASRG
jgi:hypothetical protein